MCSLEFKPQGENKSARARLSFAALLVLVYGAPPLLIFTGAVPFGFRFPALLITTVIVLVYVLWEGHSLFSLGFRKDNLKGSLAMNGCITVVALLAMAALYFLDMIRIPTIPQWRWFFAFYVLLSCPAQEFLYRGALFAEMDRAGISSRVLRIAISSAAYCFLHIIYKDSITLGVSLFIGIIWGSAYSYSRNFWGVALSHCILGTASILVGLI